MPISLRSIGANHNEVDTGKALLVFSYSTLVAVKVYGRERGLSDVVREGDKFKTNAFHSVTTSKHINKSGFKTAMEVSPEELAKLAEG